MMDAAHKHDQARRQPQGILIYLILIACPDAQHGCFDLEGVGLDQTWFMKITLSHAFFTHGIAAHYELDRNLQTISKYIKLHD